MTSPTNFRRASPARSQPSSPSSNSAVSPVRRPLSLPREGRAFYLNATGNVLPPIRINRRQQQGGGYTPAFEEAGRGRRVPQFNPFQRDPSPDSVLHPPRSASSSRASPISPFQRDPSPNSVLHPPRSASSSRASPISPFQRDPSPNSVLHPPRSASSSTPLPTP